jgi:endoglucanase
MRLDAGLGLSRLRRGDMGVFDLTDFEVVRGHVHARQLDDLAGCAVSLAVMERVCRDRRLNVRVLLTRAEEIGFGGALGAAADGLIPKRAWIISVEASKALPGVEIGGGPVIRVGDRAKTFDPLAENLLGAARTRLPKSQPVQRFLMSGGTCEATVFAVFGYHATGVAIPLGNYHNQGPGNRLAPEIVSVKDLSTAVNLIETASRNVPAGLGRDELLKGRILRYLRRYGPRLRRTSGADRNP